LFEQQNKIIPFSRNFLPGAEFASVEMYFKGKIKRSIASMEKVLNQILAELQTLKEGQTRVENRIGSLEEGQSRLENRIGSLEEGQSRLENRIGSLEEGQSRLETKIDKLEIKIESEVIEKIRALFDDRSVQMDYFTSIRDCLARVENRVEFLARQNVEHLTRLQEHDREIRLLRLEKSGS